MPRNRPSFRPLAPWQALIALPLVIAVVATTVGVLTLPALATVDATIGSVRSELLEIPPLPDVAAPAQRSRLYDAGGNPMGVLVGAENRVIVPFEDIPEVMRQAIVATEDQTFYEHNGVNEGAIARALVENLRSGDIEQGASTITQQYVKNAMLTSEQTLSRKIKEAVYATRLERELSKDEILARYLNIAYFGAGAYGVAAATERYFGVPLEQLSVDQAAMLAGMVRRPEANNPIDNPENALARRDVVLRQMAGMGFITDEEAEAASSVPWDPAGVTEPPAPPFPFFVEYVKKQLLDDPALGETREERANAIYGGGLRIHTTLDQRMQQLAEDAITAHLEDPIEDPMGGLLSVDPRTGEIRAMAVGPKTFGTCDDPPQECAVTKVNPLVPGMGGSGRQIGSTVKPILDTAALEAGIATDWAVNVRDGQPIDGCVNYVDGRKEPWKPDNYSPTSGTYDMPEAVRRSNNVFHAKLIGEIGPAAVIDMAHRLGVASVPDQPNCSLALGAVDAFPLEMVQAFGTIANHGVRCEPYAVTKITDAQGNVLVEREPTCERVIPAETADAMITMMQEVVRRGTAVGAQIGRPVGGKTGTTNDFKDAWFIGATPQIATASWVGYEIPQEMVGILGYRRITGGTVPASIWSDYMRPAMEPYPAEPLAQVRLDRYTGPSKSPSTDGDETPRPAPPPPTPSPPETTPGPSPTATEEPDPKPKPKPKPKPSPTSEPSPTAEPSPTSEPSPTAEPTTTTTTASDGDAVASPAPAPSPG